MPDTNVESALRLANTDLRSKIALLEKTLLEKERTEKTQQDAAKRYRRLFESARDGILILDAETGEVVDVNPFLLQLLGYSHDELCGQYIWEIGVFKDIAASKDAFKTLQENQYIRYENLPLETRHGLPIAVEFVSNVYLVDQGKVVQCTIRDITARNLAEAERKRLLAAIEQAGEGILMTDVRGDIEFVNPAFERTTGYDLREILGRNPRFLNSGRQDDLFYRTLWETVSGGGIWKGQIINKRKDGTPYTAETTISPVCDASGRIVNYVSVHRDITEHLQVTTQLQQAQKMEAVGLLAGGIAHEYNNMLSVIIGYTEMALEKVAPTLSLHADLEIILKAAKRSANVTLQLLAYARKQMVVPEVLDLNQSIESMLAVLRQLIGDAIHLAWIPKGNQFLIKIDPVQIGQILTNLCTNASDAIAGTGKITIETEKALFDESFCAHHAGYTAGEYVLLTVSDDGCGMKKELLDKIFEPFFTNKRKGQGTGLGLSMVHGIVKQNNGFITAYSEPGTGTTLRIYLPLCRGHTDLLPAEKLPEIPLSHGELVLVVDDELYLLTMAKRMLEKSGYRVLTAGTPIEAIELTEQYADELRLLIADIIMPEMNGRNLAIRLRSLCPSMKILFMSGYTANMIMDQGVLNDDEHFIQKPFLAKELAIKVRDALKAK